MSNKYVQPDWLRLRVIHSLLMKRDISLNMRRIANEQAITLDHDAAALYVQAERLVRDGAKIPTGTYVMKNGDVLEINIVGHVLLTKGEIEPAQD